MSNDTMKRCTKCGLELPATPEYFYRDGDKLRSNCKICVCKQVHIYRQENLEKERIQESRYYATNRDKISQRRREIYAENRNKLRTERLLHYAANPEKAREKQRLQYAAHPDMKRKALIRKARRRAQKLALPDTFTAQDWQRCLDYWRNTCAVCQYPLQDIFDSVKPHADHWIPLNYKGADNPGTVPGNMICLCGSCNSSKKDGMPTEWLNQRYGNRKANQILARVKAYFDSL
jgi:hypothetical protein